LNCAKIENDGIRVVTGIVHYSPSIRQRSAAKREAAAVESDSTEDEI
jgi:hypothetical protein